MDSLSFRTWPAAASVLVVAGSGAVEPCGDTAFGFPGPQVVFVGGPYRFASVTSAAVRGVAGDGAVFESFHVNPFNGRVAHDIPATQ